MTTETNSSTLVRSRIRVQRSDGREFPSFFVAYRELLGTAQALGYSEHQRMRANVRQGLTPRDAHGFTWSSEHARDVRRTPRIRFRRRPKTRLLEVG